MLRLPPQRSAWEASECSADGDLLVWSSVSCMQGSRQICLLVAACSLQLQLLCFAHVPI